MREVECVRWTPRAAPGGRDIALTSSFNEMIGSLRPDAVAALNSSQPTRIDARTVEAVLTT